MAIEGVTWIDGDGVSWLFDGTTGITLVVGRHGWWMPPFDLIEDERPFEAGTVVRTVKTKGRTLDCPLYFEADSYENKYALMKLVMGAFDPRRGPGILRVNDPNGDVRELPTVYYARGLELNEIWPDDSPVHHAAVVSFRVPSPFWEDAGDTTVVYASDAATAPTFFPFFPLNLSSGTILTSPTILNSGDVEFWPIWTINGPGTDLVLLNMTTGKFISMAVTLLAGEQISIDTRPDQKTVVDGDGNLLWGLVSPTSELWSFPRGSSTFQVQMNAATVDSTVQLRYRKRHYSP